MDCLSKDQIEELERLKQSGVYRDPWISRTEYRVNEKVLFNVLKLYLFFRNWDNSFKCKYFRSIFSDCPLSSGEARAAIRYGNKNDLLLVVCGSVRNRSYKLKTGVGIFD